MNPYLTELLARERRADLRRSARRYGHSVPRRRPVRYRAGWALVAIGLALAHGSGDAERDGPAAA
jgi:hypothetical protein